MNSKERHERRYVRRRLKREAKKKEYREQFDSYFLVMSPDTLLASALKCKRGVKWKCSVQKFLAHLLSNIRKLDISLSSGQWQSPGFTEFDIIERGHPRHILSVCIGERVIQRTLCDNYLTPILTRYLIYDNGATLPGKGLSFSLKRFQTHLERFIRKHGTSGYIYFFDFSSYFASIDNRLLLIKAKKYLYNDGLNKLYSNFILAFGDKGLGLGSQVSQISAVFYPNDIDHFIKDALRIKEYGRYMDDGYAIFETKEEAMQFGRTLNQLCDKNHIIVNPKKCKCISLNSNFIFLKHRYFLDRERIICRVNKTVAKKERKRLKKYKELMEHGLISFEEVYLNFSSWLGIYYNKNNFYMILNIIKYFNKLFEDKYRNYMPVKNNNRKYKVLSYISKRALYD